MKWNVKVKVKVKVNVKEIKQINKERRETETFYTRASKKTRAISYPETTIIIIQSSLSTRSSKSLPERNATRRAPVCFIPHAHDTPNVCPIEFEGNPWKKNEKNEEKESERFFLGGAPQTLGLAPLEGVVRRESSRPAIGWRDGLMDRWMDGWMWHSLSHASSGVRSLWSPSIYMH